MLLTYIVHDQVQKITYKQQLAYIETNWRPTIKYLVNIEQYIA